MSGIVNVSVANFEGEYIEAKMSFIWPVYLNRREDGKNSFGYLYCLASTDGYISCDNAAKDDLANVLISIQTYTCSP